MAKNFMIILGLTKTLGRLFAPIGLACVMVLGAIGTHAQSLVLTNPAPKLDGRFGVTMAALGQDRIIVGSVKNDAAYLFGIDGTLLATFVSPDAAKGGSFGSQVACTEDGLVALGAPGADYGSLNLGGAYLFNTNGALLTTITNPLANTQGNFGSSVSAEKGLVLIGASGFTGVVKGNAYLFSTNGALITAFTNPTGLNSEVFGQSVALFGADRLLVGAPSFESPPRPGVDRVYLFATNGTLLTTFTNPTPVTFPREHFGFAARAVGTDRVFVAAPMASVNGQNVGEAYLFNTNGVLLTTFSNTMPRLSSRFGFDAVLVDANRLLIGAAQVDVGASGAGAAFLYDTNGTLITTFTNPTPSVDDWFGISVAALGPDRVMVGAYLDDLGATDSGTAYLYNLAAAAIQAPSLAISRDLELSTITVSWSATAEGWILQTTNALPTWPLDPWHGAVGPLQTNGGSISMTVTNAPSVGNRFFRLHKP